jgi:hypothetical protein
MIELVPLKSTELLGAAALGNVATGADAANAVPTKPPNVATVVTSAIMNGRADMGKSPDYRLVGSAFCANPALIVTRP